MRKWMHKAEKIIDSIIPVVLVMFLLVTICELFIPERISRYKTWTDLLDVTVITVFAADLYFKYQRVRKLPRFLVKYWPQILATIPFFLVFRVMEGLRLQGLVTEAYINQTAQFARTPALIVREAERAGGLSRTEQLLKFKPLSRFPQLLKVLLFFEKPTGEHHQSGKSRKANQARKLKGKAQKAAKKR